MAVRKLAKSWQYDFKIPGHGRERQGGYRTKAEATAAENVARQRIISGNAAIDFRQAYDAYMEATTMKDRARDSYEHLWKRVEPELGYRQIDKIDTSALDSFKSTLPSKLGPKSINQHLILIRAILRFMWKRGKLQSVPYVPMESVPSTQDDWYTEEERDQLLAGIYRWEPQWYLFFYLTVRLGLRAGEVYAASRRQLREKPPQLVVDQAIQRGTKKREAKLVTRKNDEAYTLDISQDVVDAIKWHIEKGYAGPEFLFTKTKKFPRYIDSHVRPLVFVQQKLKLRELSHHKVGRHSVASQAATRGESIKVVQAQLGHRSEQSTHKYAHLGSKAQRALLDHLAPLAPPHVNLVSTDMKKATEEILPSG
jgi:integrase